MLRFIKNIDITLISSILIPIGLIYYHSTLFLWALILAWVLCNFICIVTHEGWGHQYIVIKNKYIGYFLDFIGYLVNWLPFSVGINNFSSRGWWKCLHHHHHRIWLEDYKLNKQTVSPYDHVQYELDNNHWVVYLFFGKRKFIPNIYNKQIIDRDIARMRDNLDPIESFIDQHINWMMWAFHLFFIILFGLEYYFYFVLLQVWIWQRYMLLFQEIIPHYGHKDRFEDHDYPWWFLVCTGNAYHVDHHRNVSVINFGPGWIKYINPQYYFTKLFYTIRVPIA